jgi:PAS domain S-box-containing protein
MATILIVDDLATNRKALVALLSREGHRLLEAANGQEGLAAVHAEHPDLVITDVLMPVVNGYEFVRQLRLTAGTDRIPVLFYTAPYGEREARAMACSSGVPYILRKPADADEVLKIVGHVLALHPPVEPPFDLDLPSADTAFTREQLRLLTDQLSEKAEDLRIANARLRALINIGLEFASQRDSDRRLQGLCVSAHDLFGAAYVTAGILGPDDRLIRRVAGSGVDVTPWARIGDSVSGIFETVVDNCRSERGSHPATESSPGRFPPGHPAVQAFLIAPIASPGHVYGWICLAGNDGRDFTEEDEQQVRALAGQVGRVFELEHEVLERRQAESELRRSERLNRNLLQHLPHRILVKDRESVTIFCNANYASDLGLQVDDVIGKHALSFYPRAQAEAHDKDDQEVMLSGVMKSTEEAYDANGLERWVRTVKVPYRDEKRQVIGVLVVFEDITERRELELQCQQAQKMEAIGQLAGGLAHDFNNLLTAILGYCELLSADLDPDDRHRDDITEIHKAGLKAAELTRQLLAFTRKEIIEPTTLDLNAVIADMKPMLVRLIREDVEIRLALQPGLALMTADRGQVEQIVVNLAINARDAMPKGGTLSIATANVELDERYVLTHRSVTPGPYVALTMTDTGRGMTPAVQARLFEPFFTTKGRGEGTGLGLASVHNTIVRSGGSITFSSEPGQGTVFTLYFPKAEATAVVAPAPPADQTPAGTETVLVVEDAAGLRSLTMRLLQRQGYSVLGAANADEAVEVFERNPSIDVLLTDVVMPGASGSELTRQLVERRPTLKVVYMSGYTEDSIVQHGVLTPGIAFLHKPFTASTLGRKIRAVLDQPIVGLAY